MEVKLRKREDILLYTGNALIIFKAFSIIELIIQYLFNSSYLESMFERIDSEFFDGPLWMNALVLIIIQITIFLYYLCIGKKAIKEAKGKKTGKVYILILVVTAAYYIISNSIMLIDSINMDTTRGNIVPLSQMSFDEILYYIIEIPIDIFIYLELLYSAIMVRRFRRILAQG